MLRPGCRAMSLGDSMREKHRSRRWAVAVEPASTIATPRHSDSAGVSSHPLDESGITASVCFGIVFAKSESVVM
jgi:hypothetical protein